MCTMNSIYVRPFAFLTFQTTIILTLSTHNCPMHSKLWVSGIVKFPRRRKSMRWSPISLRKQWLKNTNMYFTEYFCEETSLSFLEYVFIATPN